MPGWATGRLFRPINAGGAAGPRVYDGQMHLVYPAEVYAPA